MQKAVSLLRPPESRLAGERNDHKKVEIAIRAVIPTGVGSEKINPGGMESVAQPLSDQADGLE